tara:strand:- start:9 stop:338 length:330 start_codon:yes stop_codon:yes gene_type:complete
MTTNSTPRNNITEQKYLELCEEMKDIVAEKDKEMKRLQKENDMMKGTLYTIYGLSNFLLDTVPDMDTDLGIEHSVLLNIGYINDVITKIILPNSTNPTMVEIFMPNFIS